MAFHAAGMCCGCLTCAVGRGRARVGSGSAAQHTAHCVWVVSWCASPRRSLQVMRVDADSRAGPCSMVTVAHVPSPWWASVRGQRVSSPGEKGMHCSGVPRRSRLSGCLNVPGVCQSLFMLVGNCKPSPGNRAQAAPNVGSMYEECSPACRGHQAGALQKRSRYVSSTFA